MRTVQCQVNTIMICNDYVYGIHLIPETWIDFKAGQYLSLLLDNNETRFFTIASSPIYKDGIWLHIGVHSEDAEYTLNFLKNNSIVTVTLPMGDAYLRDTSDRKKLFVAGGTGFSYCCTMLETLVKQNSQDSMQLYWGNRNRDHLYGNDMLQSWQKECSHLDIQLCFIETDDDRDRKGNVLDMLCNDFVSLADYTIYIAGPFMMIKDSIPILRSLSADFNYVYGDLYQYIEDIQ